MTTVLVISIIITWTLHTNPAQLLHFNNACDTYSCDHRSHLTRGTWCSPYRGSTRSTLFNRHHFWSKINALYFHNNNTVTISDSRFMIRIFRVYRITTQSSFLIRDLWFVFLCVNQTMRKRRKESWARRRKRNKWDKESDFKPWIILLYRILNKDTRCQC